MKARDSNSNINKTLKLESFLYSIIFALVYKKENSLKNSNSDEKLFKRCEYDYDVLKMYLKVNFKIS